ncbi:MAG: 2TM domain-containing protein [Bacteroidota bacterium]
MKTFNAEKYDRAKKRVEDLKGFYIHFAVYVCINAFILVNIYVRSLGEGENFWQWSHFFVLLGWGVGLFFHAARIFGFNLILGKDWEERQIQKYMEKDREEAEKYRQS